MIIHSAHNELNGQHAHYAKCATLKADLSLEARRRALVTHRMANKAKHQPFNVRVQDAMDPLVVEDP